MSRPSFSLISAACAAVLLVGAPFAHARPVSAPPPPPPPPDNAGAPAPEYAPPPPAQAAEEGFHRHGWFAGFGLDLGMLNVENSTDAWSGGGVNLHFGGMLTDRIGILFELSGGSYNPPQNSNLNGYALAQSTIAVAGQVWLSDMIWLRGGFGATQLDNVLDNQTQSTLDGRSLLFAAGIEFLHRTSFVLDVSARMVFAGYPDKSGNNNSPRTTTWNLGVGCNWY